MLDNIFIGFYLIAFIAEILIQLLYLRKIKQNRITDDRKKGLERLLLFLLLLGMKVIPLLYILTPLLGFADYHLPVLAGWIGVGIMITAVSVFWKSHADLGRNWSQTLQIKEEHILVTRGIYHLIRHPMYAAQWLWCIAQALLLQNWIAGFSRLVVFLPLYLLRVPREEEMMIDHFGEEYRLYITCTGRIIPRLWR